MTKVLAKVLSAVLVGGAVTAGGYALDAARADPGGLGPGDVTIELGVHHSRFDTERIVVKPGTIVRFVVRNDDPIRHELIVGPPDVHARHASGTEAVHPPVPGEVTVDPLTTAETVYRFDEPGSLMFACHLPGHFEYGMKGTVIVTGS
jgi:uncharacterized cupredoxin-like copper-binding protein